MVRPPQVMASKKSNMSYPTTRRHPRSLAEAWPREHANPIEFHRGPQIVRGWVLATAIGVALAVLVAYGV